MKKKYLSSVLAAGLCLGLAACSNNENKNVEGAAENVKLTMMLTVGEQGVRDVIQEIVANYQTEHPETQIEVQFPGSNYESIMKMKMASNELPDIFDTHGWAKLRYGDYTMDLKNEPWAAKMTDTIKPTLTDESGKVYALPLNEAKDGLFYNVNVLEKYGVTPPATLDELLASAEKIKTESKGEVIPMFFSGLDPWTIGQFFDMMANPLLITPPQNEAQALLDGTFDWNKWTYLPEKFKEIYDKGYTNNDLLTAKYADEARLFAEDKLAFAFHTPSSYADIQKINPDVKMGIAPLPAIAAGDEPTFAGGERLALGAWKDTNYPEQTKDFLNYMAQPDNVKKVSDATLSPAALKDVSGGGAFSDYYDQYKDTKVLPYFDRIYLPNGMWDVMITNAQELLAGNITAKKYSENMKSEVERLKAQQK
ncbi:ABC transporter substrate-binding protein [Paenibacillus sp. FSL L8-0470]|uniref:ABC transporter substrate-binding protein n=1 Tax=unclassified Paenibacillus TaxID=185978 RepID=UPI0030FCC2D1